MTGGYCIGQHRPRNVSQPWLHIRITWGASKIGSWAPFAPRDSSLIGLQCNLDVGIFKYFPCVPVAIVATPQNVVKTTTFLCHGFCGSGIWTEQSSYDISLLRDVWGLICED